MADSCPSIHPISSDLIWRLAILMTIEKWKDWFELIALVAVVGSLIAVVVELRQTQTAMRAQAYQARAFNGIEWNFELAKDEALRSMQARLNDPDFAPTTLNESELDLAKYLMAIVRIDLDNEHFQFQSGFSGLKSTESSRTTHLLTIDSARGKYCLMNLAGRASASGR
jgi:hypothetical protein